MKKTIKQYCYNISKEDIRELTELSVRFNSVKNKFYSQYSGIKSLNLIYEHRKLIRNELVRNKVKFDMPTRHWRTALDLSICNIKANWSNVVNDVKKDINKRNELNDNEKHYVFYVLKSKDNLLYSILNHKSYDVPNMFKNINKCNINKLNKLICRLIRKHKNTISYTQKKNIFTIDSGTYDYKDNYIGIQSLCKRNRIKLKTNTNLIFTTTLKIFINKSNNSIEIHSPIDVKTKQLVNSNELNNIIGIDKNYENVIATSNGNIYGDKVNIIYNKYTDVVVKQEKNRGKIRSYIKELVKK